MLLLENEKYTCKLLLDEWKADLLWFKCCICPLNLLSLKLAIIDLETFFFLFLHSCITLFYCHSQTLSIYCILYVQSCSLSFRLFPLHVTFLPLLYLPPLESTITAPSFPDGFCSFHPPSLLLPNHISKWRMERRSCEDGKIDTESHKLPEGFQKMGREGKGMGNMPRSIRQTDRQTDRQIEEESHYGV